MPHLLQQEGFRGLSPLRLLEGDRQPLLGGVEQPTTLPLDAPQAPTVGSVADVAALGPQEQGNKFRDFVLRAGGGRPSLLNTLSAAFGQGTEEIAARRRQAVADRFNLAKAKAAEAALTATPKRNIIEDQAGIKFFADDLTRVFPKSKPKAGGTSATQEKVDLLVSTGVPRNRAVGIVSGRFVTSRHPVTGEVEIADKAGNVVDRLPANVGLQQPVTDTSTSPEATEKPVPNITEALGTAGFAQSTVNTIADLFGSDLPFPEAADAAARLDNLNLKSIQLASSGIGGRPNVFFQEQVQGLLPKPNEIFTGSGKSLKRFEALSDMFKQESARIKNDIDTQKVQPETRDDAQKRISELNSLAADYDALIQSAKPRDLPPLESFLK